MPSLGAAYVNIRGELRKFQGDLDKALAMVKGLDDKVKISTDRMTRSFDTVAAAIKGVASAYALIKTASWVSDIAKTAARYETLGVVMNTVGKNAGYSSSQMTANAEALQKLGISMTVSREATIKTVQAHIQLADSLKLARIAQDAAVIGNINSSEALERMLYGIQTAQIEVLKSIGLNVNFENSYKRLAAQTGKTAEALSEHEKLQARLNVVMRAGSDIAGSYEAAMSTAGKQITSFARYVEDFKVKMGEAFGPAMAQLIGDATSAMQHFTDVVSRKDSQQALKDMALGISGMTSVLLELAEKIATVVGLFGKFIALKNELMDTYKNAIGYQGVYRGKIDETTEGYDEYIKSSTTATETTQGFGRSLEESAEKTKILQKELTAIDKRLEDFFGSLDEYAKKINDIRSSWSMPMKDQLDGFKTASDVTWDAINDEITESIKLTVKEVDKEWEKALEKQAKDWEHFTERAQDQTADVFYDIFKNIDDGWKGLMDRMGDLFLRLLAEMAAQAIAKPIIVPFVQQAMGMQGAGASGSGGIGNGLISQGASWLWNESGLGSTMTNWLGLSGASAASGGVYGSTAGMSALLQANSGYMTGSMASLTGLGEFSMATDTATSGLASFSQTLNALAPYMTAFALGSLGYSYIGDAIGLPQSEYSGIGAGLGAAGGYALGTGSGILAGTAYGSYAGPIGAVIGAIVGGLAGSLFGGQEGKKYISMNDFPGWSGSQWGWDQSPAFAMTDQDWYYGAVGKSGMNDYDQSLVEMRYNTAQAAGKVVQGVFDWYNDWIGTLPEELGAKMKADLGQLDFSTEGVAASILRNRGGERAQLSIEDILESLGEMMQEEIQPVVQKNIEWYLGKTITDYADTLSKMDPNSSFMKGLKNSGLFVNAAGGDFSKAEGVSFENYVAGSGQVITGLEQLSGAWSAVSSGFDLMIEPLSQFEQQVKSTQATVDSAIAVLEQLGFSEEALAEARNKGLEVVKAVYDRQAKAIDEGLTDNINRLTLSDTDYQRWKAETQFIDTLESIAELGPDYAYLKAEAKEFYDLQVEGIKKAKAAQAMSDLKGRWGTWGTVASIKNVLPQEDIAALQIMGAYGYNVSPIGGATNSIFGAFQNPDMGVNWDQVGIFLQSLTPALVAEWAQTPGWENIESDINSLNSAYLTHIDVVEQSNDKIKESLNLWSDLSDSIREQILKLQTGLDNPADVFERIGIQNQAISGMLGGKSLSEYLNSLGSDAERVDAIQKLQGMYGDRLGLYQEAYQRPSLEYQGAFGQTIGDLTGLADYADLMKSEYQIQWEQLNALNQIAENTSALSDIPQAADGAWTGSGGLYFTHPNELILNPDQQRAFFGAAVAPSSSGETNVSITINAYGGNSDEVAEKVSQRLMRELPAAIDKRGPLRISIKNAANNRV